jgi:hypothetical protein
VRERDPGVPAGGRDERPAGSQQTALLGLVDESRGDTILDAAAGVARLELDRDAAWQPGGQSP